MPVGAYGLRVPAIGVFLPPGQGGHFTSVVHSCPPPPPSARLTPRSLDLSLPQDAVLLVPFDALLVRDAGVVERGRRGQESALRRGEGVSEK